MYAIHVGKYTSPMDPMGNIWFTIVGGFLKTPFEKYVQIGSFFPKVNIPNILPTWHDLSFFLIYIQSRK